MQNISTNFQMYSSSWLPGQGIKKINAGNKNIYLKTENTFK